MCLAANCFSDFLRCFSLSFRTPVQDLVPHHLHSIFKTWDRGFRGDLWVLLLSKSCLGGDLIDFELCVDMNMKFGVLADICMSSLLQDGNCGHFTMLCFYVCMKKGKGREGKGWIFGWFSPMTFDGESRKRFAIVFRTAIFFASFTTSNSGFFFTL